MPQLMLQASVHAGHCSNEQFNATRSTDEQYAHEGSEALSTAPYYVAQFILGCDSCTIWQKLCQRTCGPTAEDIACGGLKKGGEGVLCTFHWLSSCLILMSASGPSSAAVRAAGQATASSFRYLNSHRVAAGSDASSKLQVCRACSQPV